jgi:orotate phosphoribosyltransferase
MFDNLDRDMDKQSLFIYEPTTDQVAESLVKTGSYLVEPKLPPNEWWEWKSGIKAPCYCNNRHLNCHPQERKFIGKALSDSVQQAFPDAEYIIGLATAGIPWAKTVADHLNLPLAYVRSSVKSHGIGNLVECNPPNKVKAVIIDDLVASGGSLKQAINALTNETGINVLGIHSIVNWNFEKMRDNLREYKVYALISYPHILEAALKLGRIDETEYHELYHFYQNPRQHIWHHQKLTYA